jgi:hypothetical protein
MVRTKELDQFSKRSLPEELLRTVEDLLWLITRTVEGFDQMFVHHLNDTSFRVPVSFTSCRKHIPGSVNSPYPRDSALDRIWQRFSVARRYGNSFSPTQLFRTHCSLVA